MHTKEKIRNSEIKGGIPEAEADGFFSIWSIVESITLRYLGISKEVQHKQTNIYIYFSYLLCYILLNM